MPHNPLPTADEAEGMTVEARITALVRAGCVVEFSETSPGQRYEVLTYGPVGNMRETGYGDTLGEALLAAWPDVEGDDGNRS